MNKREELVKGFWSLFSDGNEGSNLNSHPKKGSEIKASLDKLVLMTMDQKEEAMDKMTAELSHTGFAPDVKCDYQEEYYYLMDFVPKKFSYDMIYHGEQYVDTSRGIEEQAINKPTPEQQHEMREYNKYAIDYIDACVNKIKLESLKRNIQDGKTYNLTTNQLSMLGF
jgi:hypothetical protein